MSSSKPVVFVRCAAVASLFASLASTALAHHGWSEYDSATLLTISGTIEESSYEHPHGYIKLKAPGKTWVAVLAPPSRMDNRGLSKELLKAGATATVEGYANRDKPEEMRAERITLGGKTTELR
ncbi:MAG: DUF6152 family protein [Casimicrobiaceae bacterium]